MRDTMSCERTDLPLLSTKEYEKTNVDRGMDKRIKTKMKATVKGIHTI